MLFFLVIVDDACVATDRLAFAIFPHLHFNGKALLVDKGCQHIDMRQTFDGGDLIVLILHVFFNAIRVFGICCGNVLAKYALV